MSKNSNTTPADVQNLLGSDRPPRWWQRTTTWIAVAAVALAAGGYVYWQSQQSAKAAPVYITEAMKKGDITLSVAANGTLQPTRSVNIGSELSGTVLRVLVDVNDKVKKGQVLVELDAAKLKDQVTRSRAALGAANSSVAQSAATVKEARSNFG